MRQLQFGTAVRDITPDYPVWAHGYGGRTEQSCGVLEPISLGCLAVGNGDTTVLIVTADMIGIRAYACEELYALLEREVGIGYPNVMLSCSHTHFAPALHTTSFSSPKIALVEPDPRFVEDVKIKLVEAARESIRNMQAARLETARPQVPQLLFNRRTRKDDGLVHNCLLYPEDSTPYLFSPVDPEFTVLRAVDDNGVRAVLTNLGCHPVTGCTAAEDNYKFSADYPFYLRQTIAEKWHCPVFFSLGSGGDAVPINRRDDCRERIGSVLGNTAILAERTYRQDLDTSVSAEFATVEATTIVKPDPATARQAYEQARAAYLALFTNSTADTASSEYKQAANDYSKAMTAFFRSRQYPENRYTIKIQFVRIGSTVFVGLPFEVLSEISLKMKEACPNSVLVSCAGGYQGYLPLAYEYERGGYEASEDSTHFEPGTADRLLETILKKL